MLLLFIFLPFASLQVCGDCILDWPTETCDDCNTVAGDGCDATCQNEVGFLCIHTADSSVCINELCGDGLSIQGQHACDDGNNLSKDGCSSTCQLEPGYTCTPAFPTVCTEDCDGVDLGWLECDGAAGLFPCCVGCTVDPAFTYNKFDGCAEICGNGINRGFKECEDGMAYGGDEYYGDGCNWLCELEPGFTCLPGPFTVVTCTEICGNDAADGTFDYYYYPCDDGNNVDGDGCDSTCNVEPGYECYGGNPLEPDFCYEICGDGLDYGMWWCDDGNLVSGDGCSSSCMIERGWSCTGGDPTQPDVCTEVCGDAIDHHFYECDDGNLIDGDGCDSNCNVEPGWKPLDGDMDAADKMQEVCGDARRISTDPGKCDDGNKKSGDGCSQLCDIETGWTCTGGSPTSFDVCEEICGDGINAGGVECDDGNNAAGDGCTADCFFETGYTCSGGTLFSPDVCQEICGDGKNYGMWECDDGNLVNGDGCDSTCFVETEWFCFNGDTVTRDTCKLLPRPIVTTFELTNNNTLATVIFNETMILKDYWNDTFSMELYVDGPKGPYDLVWELVDVEFFKTQSTQKLEFTISITDQIYPNLNQTLVLMFKDQGAHRGTVTQRPIYNYTVGATVAPQEDTGNNNCNAGWMKWIIPVLYGITGLFILGTAVYAKLTMLPFIYLTTQIQILQITPVMALMWPTCLLNLFRNLSFLNFESSFIYNRFPKEDREKYNSISSYYTDHGYETRIFTYNVLDTLIFAGLFLAFIPVFLFLGKLAKNETFQSQARRYYGSIFHVVLVLIYMKISLCALLQYRDFTIYDNTQGFSDLITIIASFFIIFGLPAIHILLLVKRATLNYGIEKKLPPKKNKGVLDQHAEEEKGEEEKKDDPKKTKIDAYLQFLANPFVNVAQKEEEEKKKKAEEKAKKKAEKGDDYTDSEEEEMTDEQRNQFLDQTRKYNEYRFKHSFLYIMSWGDLNDHYASKLTFYLVFSLKRLIYAYILDLHYLDGCTTVKYLVMINAASLAYLLLLQPFRQTFMYNCAVNQEFWTTTASLAYFAYYHTNSPRDTVEGFAYIILISLVMMHLITIVLIVYELLKRVAKDKVDDEVLAPILPDMTPKNKKQLEGTKSEESEQSIEQSSKEESEPEIGDKEPTQRKKNDKSDETDDLSRESLVSQEISESEPEESEDDDEEEEPSIEDDSLERDDTQPLEESKEPPPYQLPKDSFNSDIQGQDVVAEDDGVDSQDSSDEDDEEGQQVYQDDDDDYNTTQQQPKELGLRNQILMDFDEQKWEKKIVKIYKALVVMEKEKSIDPYFSISFSDLANFIHLSHKNSKGEHSQYSGMTTMTGFSSFEQQFMFKNSFQKKDSTQLSDYSNQFNEQTKGQYQQNPQPYQNQYKQNQMQQQMASLPNQILNQSLQRVNKKESSRSLSIKNEEIEEEPEEQNSSPPIRKTTLNHQALYELSHDKKAPTQSISYDVKHQELTQLLQNQNQSKFTNSRQSIQQSVQIHNLSQVGSILTIKDQESQKRTLQSNMSNMSGPKSISQMTYNPSVSETPHSRSRMGKLKKYEGLNQSTIQNIKQEIFGDQFAMRQNALNNSVTHQQKTGTLPQIRQSYQSNHKNSKRDKNYMTMYKQNKNMAQRNNSNSHSGSKKKTKIQKQAIQAIAFEPPDPQVNRSFIIDQGMIEAAFAKQNRLSKEPLQTIPETADYKMVKNSGKQQPPEISENSRYTQEDYDPYIYKNKNTKLPAVNLQQAQKIDQALTESSNQMILAASPASNQAFSQNNGKSFPINYNSDYQTSNKKNNLRKERQSIDDKVYVNLDQVEDQENFDQRRRMCSTSLNYNRNRQNQKKKQSQGSAKRRKLKPKPVSKESHKREITMSVDEQQVTVQLQDNYIHKFDSTNQNWHHVNNRKNQKLPHIQAIEKASSQMTSKHARNLIKLQEEKAEQRATQLLLKEHQRLQEAYNQMKSKSNIPAPYLAKMKVRGPEQQLVMQYQNAQIQQQQNDALNQEQKEMIEVAKKVQKYERNSVSDQRQQAFEVTQKVYQKDSCKLPSIRSNCEIDNQSQPPKVNVEREVRNQISIKTEKLQNYSRKTVPASHSVGQQQKKFTQNYGIKQNPGYSYNISAAYRSQTYDSKEKPYGRDTPSNQRGGQNQQTSLQLTDDEKHMYGYRCPQGYEKIKLLGRGGCALVWLAKDVKFDRQVAIKQFPKNNNPNLDSGYKEMQVNRKFFQFNGQPYETYANHPGLKYICKMFDCKEDKNDLWLIFEVCGKPLSKALFEVKGEFYRGERIYSILHNSNMYSIFEQGDSKYFRQFVMQMAFVLNLMQMAGLVHSDLKPENILIEQDSETLEILNMKIIDFGSSFSYSKLSSAVELTTPEYLPPEVLNYLDSKTTILLQGGQVGDLGKKMLPWSLDMWSLGCILLETVTGFPLWLSYKGRIVKESSGIYDEDTTSSVTMVGLFGIQGRPAKKIAQKQIQFAQNIKSTLRKQFNSYLSLGQLLDDTNFIDLLTQMLQINPKFRISPKEVLDHPFLCQQ